MPIPKHPKKITCLNGLQDPRRIKGWQIPHEEGKASWTCSPCPWHVFQDVVEQAWFRPLCVGIYRKGQPDIFSQPKILDCGSPPLLNKALHVCFRGSVLAYLHHESSYWLISAVMCVCRWMNVGKCPAFGSRGYFPNPSCTQKQACYRQ